MAHFGKVFWVFDPYM